MNNKEDDFFTDLFAEAMQQVQPIEKTAKITPSTTPLRKNRKKLPQDIHQKTNIFKHHSPTHAKSTLQEDNSAWVLRSNGISPDVLKKLSNGQFPINKTIDLHGMTRDKSIAALEKVIQSSLHIGDRVICVVHGRGLHSPDGKAVLKQRIYQWLKDDSISGHILAVTPAPHTAGGSCLVLLRRDKHI